MTPVVRVVVVSWNGAHLIERCLDSLLDQDMAPGDVEIVVVDNASTDGSVELIEERYPSVVVRVTGRNLGFAGGVNVGLADLDARYAVLLNNDATFEPDAVRRLVEHLEQPENDRVAAATARILLTAPDASGQVLVNSTGNVLSRSGAAADRDWLQPDDGTGESPTDVFGFCGGAAALRASALREVGLFDASLFLYYEDTDLSWRLRAAGWDIHYVREAVAHHEHAASSDSTSALFRYYNTRNSLLVFARHAPLPAVLRSLARQVAALLYHVCLRREAPALVRARARALVDTFRSAPSTLAARRSIWPAGPAGSARRRRIYDAGLS